MEALIYHFKIVMGETDIPAGEVYHSVEGGNGELGFYLVSDGGRNSIQITLEDLVYLLPSVSRMIKGAMISDAIVTMSSMNVIAGELDG